MLFNSKKEDNETKSLENKEKTNIIKENKSLFGFNSDTTNIFSKINQESSLFNSKPDNSIYEETANYKKKKIGENIVEKKTNNIFTNTEKETKSVTINAISTSDSIFGKKSEFIPHYEKYQFILKIESRKQLEKKIVEEEELMNRPMIKNNIIGNAFSSIKEILIKILKEIILIDDNNNDLINTLKNIFKNNHIYFDSLFDFLIPTKFSDTIEYKYNKLILEVAHFLFPWEGILENADFNENDKNLIKERLSLIMELTYFIKKNKFNRRGE
jgi:hypothetical protein